MTDDCTSPWGRREFLKAAGATTATAAIGGVAAADSESPESGERDDELVVGVSASTRLSTASARIQEALSSTMDVVQRNETLGYLAVKIPGESTVSATGPHAAQLRRVPGVKYVEEVVTFEPHMESNDEYFSDQYAPQLVNAPAAWEKTLGSEEVTIAIVDMGVQYDHEDLERQFGDLKGRDFRDDDPDPMPKKPAESHGTHVAGIASATTDNGIGVAGMANATLLSCRALGTRRGASVDVADAVQWAADQGADLINMSMAGDYPSNAVRDAVSYALNQGTLSICCAGNYDGQGGYGVSYPAAYDETVAVSAINEEEDLLTGSHYGDEIDITAPGFDVLSSSTRFSGYERFSGTSMAAPVVTGVAALGLATHPSWGPAEVRSKLKETAVDVGLTETKQGAGRVDAANLVDVGEDGNRKPTAKMSVTTTEPSVGEPVTFDGSESTDPDGEIVEYRWEDDDGDVLTGEVVEAFGPEERAYPVTLTVTDDDGATDSTTETIYVGGKDETPDPNILPRADFRVTPAEPKPGESISFDGTISSDPDGTIEEYHWLWEGGGTGSGGGAELLVPGLSEGSYEYTLTVTDDDGATDTVTKTVSVISKDGQRGTDKNAATDEGRLAGSLDSETFTYTTTLPDPSQVTISLEGPDDADFDLFVTTDGRTPAIYDSDAMSVSPKSQERVVLEDVDANQELGILVDSWEGGGAYTVSIDELGS